MSHRSTTSTAHLTRFLAPMALALVLAASVVTIVGGRSHAQTQIDISGDWGVVATITVPPDIVRDVVLTTECLLLIVQDDRSLSAAMACQGFGGGGRLIGSIDDAAAFSLPGDVAIISVELSGTVSDDEQSIEGTFSIAKASGTFSGRRIASLWGDADCNRIVTSVDALLVLQVHGRVVHGVLPRCSEFADVNVDGRVNSVDALLIQQREAGLIDRLPAL